MARSQQAPVQYEVVRLGGGLDLVTPSLDLKPGVAIEALNYECSVSGGYTRVAGYERFDGRALPSTETYNALTLDAPANTTPGAIISTATGSATVIGVDSVYVYYALASGSFSVGQIVSSGGSPVGTVLEIGAPAPGRTAAVYSAAAADARRKLIGVVPGAGPVRGVAVLFGTVYAWRDNAGSSELCLWRSTASGWQRVMLGHQAFFGSATAVINEGDTVVGGTSGATGVVTRVVLESGTFGSAGAGRLIFSTVSGTFAAGEALRVGGVQKATSTQASANITLLPGGRVQTVQGNFGGRVGGVRLYGCDGTNLGFEFDGAVYVPIRTGTTVDAPDNVAVHRGYLFFSFGPSLQNSGLGAPYFWLPIYGADEKVVPGNITNLLPLPGDQSSGALMVSTDASNFILYGSSTLDFRLTHYNTGTGPAKYTAQNLEQAYGLDNKGISSLNTTLSFGNFSTATLTYGIRPFTQLRRAIASASALNREKSQYRVFYSDGFGLYLTMVNGRSLGVMPVQFPDAVLCWCEDDAANGAEGSYFGSSSGYVYRLDSGTSFDGQDIASVLTLCFNSVRSPRVLKRWRKASVEVASGTFAEFQVASDIAYAESNRRDQMDAASYMSDLDLASWDATVWDSFSFDGRSLTPTEIELQGSGENISVKFSSSVNYVASYTLNTMIIHYTPRRGLR